MEFNLADLFESVVDRVGDREALVVGDRRLTYRGLDERANRLAHHLEAQGIGPGDHVGCHMMNGSEYLETMLACFKIRAVPINVNYRYVQEELRYLYADADLVATVVDGEFLSRIAPLRDDLPLLRHVVVVGEPDGEMADAVDYDAVTRASSPERGFAPRSGDDLMMIYTGGTTGMPKGVMWRQADIFFAGMLGGNPMGEPVSRPEEVAENAANGGGLVSFPAPPLMHGAAELASFISFWAGNKVVLIRRYSGHGALSLVDREGANSISVVGDAMAVPLIDAAEEGDYDLSSLYALGSAGAILSKSVRERLLQVKPDLMISDAFGASEVGYTGAGVEGSNPDEGLRFRPNPRTAIVSDDLRIIEPGSDEVGRVAQRGHVPLGYYNDPDKTARTFVEIDGERWVLLGDMARIDGEGVIHFLGRGSVCINSGGEKIHPEEVEAAIKAHPGVADVVVVGIPDDRWGQRAVAVLSLQPGQGGLTQADIEEHLRERIARYKVPRVVVVVDELQRSPTGKADYRWARETAQARVAAVAGT